MRAYLFQTKRTRVDEAYDRAQTCQARIPLKGGAGR